MMWRGFMEEKEEMKPYPKNAPGAFYVENGECICCGAPEDAAPNLMAHDGGDGLLRYHCYFKQQPATSEELDQAINAILLSCCGAVRYGGSDPVIKKRISELYIESLYKLPRKK